MKRKLQNRLLILVTEKEQREKQRITQTKLAQEIGVSIHTIGSWLRNDVTKFEAPIVERLCEYFQCELWDLLVLEEIDE
jgi:DNA-binding Xre family transcriptional regulator